MDNIDMNLDTKSNAGAEPVVNNFSEMSREELEALVLKKDKAYNDQKGRAEKLKQELDTNKVVTKPVEKTVELPKEAPVVVKSSNEDDMYSVATLVSQGYNKEEIALAKKLVGAFGNNLSEVTASAGFQAQLNTTREMTKSSEMQIEDLTGLIAPTDGNTFMSQVDKGLIDLSNPTHAARFKKLSAQGMRNS